MQLLSVFGGGLFLIPLLTIAGAIFFGYQAYKAHNSNSTQQTPGGGPTINNTGNVPYTQIGQFWFSVALVIATIVIIALMVSDK